MFTAEFLINLIIDYNSLIRRAASSFNISSSQAFNILSIPFDGISMSLLSEKLGLDTSTLTRNINKLINLDYVIKTSHLYDKRVHTITLTSTGQAIKEQLYNKINDLNYEAISHLSIDEKETVHTSIEKLAWSLECDRNN